MPDCLKSNTVKAVYGSYGRLETEFEFELQGLFTGKAHSEERKAVACHGVHRLLFVLLVCVGRFGEHWGLGYFSQSSHFVNQPANRFHNVAVIFVEFFSDDEAGSQRQIVFKDLFFVAWYGDSYVLLHSSGRLDA